MENKKFIFLDVDGPLKPARAYLSDRLKNANYGGFDPIAIDIVNTLCERTGAEVVFNTTWNSLDIIDIAQKEGLKAKIAGKTTYPSERLRLDAILRWLVDNKMAPLADWVALDDCIIDHPNAIRICPENGISVEDYRQACSLLGNPHEFRVLV